MQKVKPEDIKQEWWKETVVYQIYPRSYQDSSGDGVGDLRGIINRLDYIADLGVETIWLSPIFKSPNDDNGYDVSDYRDIMDEFGSMKDFDDLLAGMKERNLRLILDLVPNHSSDEHFWFQEAKKSKDNPYRDYYYWKPPNEDGTPPTNWVSFFCAKYLGIG
jgi:oligo-1,6-glucosidase